MQPDARGRRKIAHGGVVCTAARRSGSGFRRWSAAEMRRQGGGRRRRELPRAVKQDQAAAEAGAGSF